MSANEPQVPIETPSPAVESPAPVSQPAPEPTTPSPPPATDRRATLAHQFDKAPTERGKHAQYQPRDNGKFAGAPQFPKPPAGTDPGADAPAKPPVSRPSMPKSLKLELQPHWDAAPLDLLNAVIERETNYEKGVVPLKEKARQADDLLNEFKPYEMLLRMENVTPQQAIAPLLQTAAILRTGSPVQKAQAVAQTMRQFGISLEHVQQMLSGNAPPQPVHDPQFSQLAQQVEQLKAQQQQQSDAHVQSTLSAFKASHKHYDAVRPQMAAFVAHPESLGVNLEGMDEGQLLQAAYDAACYANPGVRQQMLAEQQAKELAERQVTQAKNAAVQVTGAPNSGPAPPINPQDRRAILEAQFNRAQR